MFIRQGTVTEIQNLTIEASESDHLIYITVEQEMLNHLLRNTSADAKIYISKKKTCYTK